MSKIITFKNKQYSVPSSWDEITLRQQLEVSRANDEFKTDVTKHLSLIAGYTGVPVDIIRKSTPQEVAPLFKHLTFINEPIPDKPVMEFEFKGHHYTVVKNLMEQEFQDYISMEIALQNNKEHTYEALPLLMAIMCKRKKEDGTLESLDDYDLNERAEEFLDVPISIANGLMVFFYQLEKNYRMLSLLSSHQDKAILMRANEVENTLKEQDGKGLLYKLLIFLMRIYLKSLKEGVMKSSNTTQSKSFIQRWRMTCKKWRIKKPSIKRKQKDKKNN